MTQAFFIGCKLGKQDVVEELIDSQEVRHRMTCCHFAAKNGKLNVLQYLLGVDGIGDEQHFHALISAAQFGQLEVIKYFEEDPVLGVESFEVALEVAAQVGTLPAVKHFVEAGIKANNLSKEFLLAGEGGHLDVVKFLMDKAGVTPYVRLKLLRKCSKEKNLNVADYLRKHLHGLLRSFVKPAIGAAAQCVYCSEE